MQQKIQKLGKGSKVETIVEQNKKAIHTQIKTLDNMLSRVTDENIHSEVSTGSSVGNER